MLSTVKHINYLHSAEQPELAAFYANTEAPLNPGYVSGPFIRDCYIIQYIHSGKGVLEIDGKSFEVSAGQCFVIFPGATVTMTTDLKDPWGKSWVCLHGTKISHYLSCLGVTAQFPIFPWKSCPEILAEIDGYIGLLNTNAPLTFEFDQIICGNRLFKLLFDVCDRTPEADRTHMIQQGYVKRAIEFILLNYNHRITVQDIANHVNLNRTYFSTLFKTHTGYTPQEFLLKSRIDKACDLLANPSASVASVAFSLGYEPHVFSRLFKAAKGISPIRYKNRALAQDK